jgi:hypothetical protein
MTLDGVSTETRTWRYAIGTRDYRSGIDLLAAPYTPRQRILWSHRAQTTTTRELNAAEKQAELQQDATYTVN